MAFSEANYFYQSQLESTFPPDLFTMLLGCKLAMSGISRTVKLDIPPVKRDQKDNGQ